MNSSRQLLLGTGVFLGGGLLLFSMVKQMDQTPGTETNGAPEVAEVSEDTSQSQTPLTADLETEERILAQKREEREQRMTALDQRTREFLTEQERAEALAMEKARLENEQYRNNAIEPVIDDSPDSQSDQYDADDYNSIITKPVITARQFDNDSRSTSQSQQNSSANNSSNDNNSSSRTTSTNNSSNSQNSNQNTTYAQQGPSSTVQHKVTRGEGIIKLSRQYNVPVEAIAQANKISKNATLNLGQTLTIPSRSQVDRLVRDYNYSHNISTNNQNNSSQSSSSTSSNSAPTSQISYTVKSGDGLIKLARQYNVPVSALAQANGISTNTSLRVGQKLTIPSRRQVSRLEREAQQQQAAEQNKRNAQQRLIEARRKAANGEARGTFGVQVALADNQQKADEIVRKMRSAGYSASTSATSRGVRVIVGPERGKEAALALKDKINADSRTGVTNAWVLYWR